MSFLDPTKPTATCDAPECKDCPVEGALHCHFRPIELAHFLILCAPAFIIGGAGVLDYGVWVFVIWIAILVGYFGFLEIRVMCSHCPHYAEAGKSLQCWANHGSPKLWKYRPGPMSGMEKVGFFSGMLLVWGYPPPFLVLNGSWLMLVLYALTTTGFFMTLKMFLCSQCINFACPLNSVDQARRDLFFQRNPSVAEPWPGRAKD